MQTYRSSLLSDEFISLLERAYERTSKREDNITNGLAIAKFERDFATIDRVRRRKQVELASGRIKVRCCY